MCVIGVRKIYMDEETVATEFCVVNRRKLQYWKISWLEHSVSLCVLERRKKNGKQKDWMNQWIFHNNNHWSWISHIEKKRESIQFVGFVKSSAVIFYQNHTAPTCMFLRHILRHIRTCESWWASERDDHDFFFEKFWEFSSFSVSINQWE